MIVKKSDLIGNVGGTAESAAFRPSEGRRAFLFLFLKHPFYEYNLYILLFNLLPIFPLDGSKIFNLFLNQLFSFKKSHIYSIILSIIMLSFFLFQKNLMIF